MSIGRHICKLAGYAPTLPTPFTENDAIDAAVFERFCELQISNGVTALVVGGTTGEAPNLSRDEHCKLVRIATGVSRGRVPIVAGAGSNSTQHAIELTKDAEAWLSHGSVDDTQRDDSSSGFTKWLNFTSAIEESRRIREWLLGILRFAVTLEQCDRAAVMYLAAEMDRFGSSTTQSRFSYFTRTSAKLCDCIIAKRDFDNLAQLRFHIKND